ncbi:calcium-binding protein, partial [uncultured Lamprocystis sp.]
GNDTLNGGTGADTLIGGADNDTYVVDNTADVVTELASAGTDTVQASVTYSLAANVERLTLTGSSAINGTGNTLANLLTGNTAANTLNGGSGADTLVGGTGNDTLTGGTEADVFKFVTAGQGVDRLTDFTSVTDKIQVVSANFGNLAVGTLATSRFLAAGSALLNANAVFLYSATTGSLAFDSNGNGAGGVSQIASLTGPKTLLAADIQVVAA